MAESRKWSLSGDGNLNGFVNIQKRAGKGKDLIYTGQRKIKRIKSQEENEVRSKAQVERSASARRGGTFLR